MIGWSLGILVNSLLNLIDAIAVGQLFFPAGDPFFGRFALDGVGLYLMVTSAAQAVLPLFTSFRGAVAAGMMAECLPFINQIVRQISRETADQDEAVRVATVLTAFVVHTLTIAAAFFLLAILRLDRVAQRCPKQVLLGAMGGIGVFLVRTALEQAMIRDGSAAKQAGIVAAGAVPAVLTIWSRRRNGLKSPFLVPVSLISLMALFYTVALLLGYSVKELRTLGWVIAGPAQTENPFRLYSFLSLRLVDWPAVFGCWQSFLASAAFAMLQLPINVPSFGRSTRQPVSLRREFLANAAANVVTSVVGMQPSYFMYTPSVLLVQAGADHRYCSYGLALTTGLALFFGLGLVAYIPIPAVLFLLFYLGFELALEATIDSRRFAHPLDQLQIAAMMVVMAAFGFAQGLLCGLGLAFIRLAWEGRSLTGSVRTLDLVYVVDGWQNLVRYGPAEDAFLSLLRESEVTCLALPSFYSFANQAESAEAMRNLLCDIDCTRYVIVDLTQAAGHIPMGMLEAIEETLGEMMRPWIGAIVIVSREERCKRISLSNGEVVKVVPSLIDAVVWIDRIMMLELDIDLVRAPPAMDESEADLESSQAPLIPHHTIPFYTNHSALLSAARNKSVAFAALEAACLESFGPLETVTVPAGTILWHPQERLRAIYILTSPASRIVEFCGPQQQRRRWGGGRAWIGVREVMDPVAATETTCVVLTDCRVMILPDAIAHRHASAILSLFPTELNLDCRS